MVSGYPADYHRSGSEAPRPKGRGFPERKISISDGSPLPRLKRRGLQVSKPVKALVRVSRAVEVAADAIIGYYPIAGLTWNQFM